MPERKKNRLSDYDYSSPGVYFLTLCAKDRAPVFGTVTVGPSSARLPEVNLTTSGLAVEKAIRNIPTHYPTVCVEAYVIMPNHVHLLLRLEGRAVLGPTVSRVVQQMKGYASKLAGMALWQPRYYDHVVRNREEYDRILNYILTNPAKWTEDKYYIQT